MDGRRVARRATAVLAVLALPALTGCVSDGSGTVTIDGAKHRATSLRCSVVGLDHVIEFRSAKSSARMVVRDGIPVQLISLRLPGGPTGTMGITPTKGAGRATIEQRGMRFLVRGEAVPLTPSGRAAPSSDVVAFSADVHCAKVY